MWKFLCTCALHEYRECCNVCYKGRTLPSNCIYEYIVLLHHFTVFFSKYLQSFVSGSRELKKSVLSVHSDFHKQNCSTCVCCCCKFV